VKTIIHVNQHVIKKNRIDGGNRPVLTVKTYKDNKYCHEAHLTGPGKVIYRPDKPLSCGAHVWIETEHPVETFSYVETILDEETTHDQAKCYV